MEDTVVHGVDLNESKPITDRRNYRLVTLANGLECLLISDINGEEGEESEDESGDEERGAEESGSDGGESERGEGESCAMEQDTESGKEESQDEEDNEEGRAGQKRAAVSISVGVGSFSDPEDCLGLAHFLEHMLFMGSEKYPKENEFDAFLAKNGGESNAYTEGEYTNFYFTVKTAGLKKALDIFAGFFTKPLMLEDSVDRELNAIESEFQLSRRSEGTRAEGIASMATRKNHPLAKFGWGNLKTLKEEPARVGVEPLKRLRPFYDQHYVAPNLKLSVCASMALDELECIVLETCKNICPRPSNAPENWVYQPLDLSKAGFPFQGPTPKVIEHGATADGELLLSERVSLGCIFYIVPIVDTHRIHLTWQLPSQLEHYKSKPKDYLSHLIGHESTGSILSIAKERGWATSLLAGGDSDDSTNTSGFSLFTISMTLTKRGMCEYKQVVALVFEYISMLRATGPQKWVYDELAEIAKLDYQFLDDTDPSNIVQEHTSNMLHRCKVERSDLLDGAYLFKEYRPDLITNLLEHLTVEGLKVELLSSLFGRDSDYRKGGSVDEVDVEMKDALANPEGLGGEESDSDEESDSSSTSGSFDVEPEHEDLSAEPSDFKNNPSLREDGVEPITEPYFGARFWVELLDTDTLQEWSALVATTTEAVKATDSSGVTASGLRLPDRNQYIATDISLVPFPEDDALHPLVGAFVKVSVTTGKKKSWLHGFVQSYNAKLGEIETFLEDDIDKAFRYFELCEDDRNESSFDGSKTSLVIKLVSKGTRWFGKGQETDMVLISRVEGPSQGQQLLSAALRLMDRREAQPNLTSAIAESANRMPELATTFNPKLASCSDDTFMLYALQDRLFGAPKAVFNLNVVCGENNAVQRSPLNSVATDIFIGVVTDLLTNEAYFASMAEIEYRIRKSDSGLALFFSGFNDKLFKFVQVVLEYLLVRAFEVDATTTGLFQMHREAQIRYWSNKDMKVDNRARNLRLQFLRPVTFSPAKMLAVFESDALKSFPKVLQVIREEVLATWMLDGLVCGNVDTESHTKTLYDIVTKPFKRFRPHTLPRLSFPRLQVINMEPGKHYQIDAVARDPNDNNSAIRVYFQIGPDNLEDRTTLDLLESILYEPVYDTLRTKLQLGYSVSCQAKLTNKVLGFAVSITSDTHSVEQLEAHTFTFLEEFHKVLQEMDDASFEENVNSLVEMKLEADHNLEAQAYRHWETIADHKFVFQESRLEAFELFGISKERLVECYERWMLPTNPKTRVLSTRVRCVTPNHVEDMPESNNTIPHEVVKVDPDNISSLHNISEFYFA
mmetsp:Transcript_19812/g.36722  ORF Transcript_19812/g.36722 Transcript_19812/m.36722 type:complete len:1301 (-) Transcript_19812:129-4031(-)